MTLHWHKMTARERDAAVAERVCGWFQCQQEPNGDFGGRPPGITYRRILPTFTTTPDACAQVISAMRARGFTVRVENSLNGDCWDAVFCGTDGDRQLGRGTTMPEAVSISSLRAIGVTVETGDTL